VGRGSPDSLCIKPSQASQRVLPELPQQNQPISARILSAQDIENIIEWIVGSREGRRTAWEQIPGRMGIDIGRWTIRHALRKEGFSRQVARRQNTNYTNHEKACLGPGTRQLDPIAVKFSALE
jgi:hypothetical protein